MSAVTAEARGQDPEGGADRARQSWDPQQYARFSDERSRPFFELVARINGPVPRVVVDLGCGNGTLTSTLCDRWPSAEVIGVDNSAEMLADACAGVVRFEVGDIRSWSPSTKVDVVVSNAALQWVPGHLELLERFVSWLPERDGWLAFQVPGNFTAPSHVLLAELRRSTRWRDRVGDDGLRGVPSLDEYADTLGGLGMTVDAWETTYLQMLRGPDAVLEWVKGTALRPVLTALAGPERDAFLAEYAELLREAYPTRNDDLTRFPFRRLFVVACR